MTAATEEVMTTRERSVLYRDEIRLEERELEWNEGDVSMMSSDP